MILISQLIYYLGVRAMGLSAFKKTRRELLPFIITAKPMTDLCSTCQVNNTLIYRLKNMDETNKSKRFLHYLLW